jgi:hypothetical protein
VEADRGDLNINGPVVQFDGDTITGGTWIVRSTGRINLPEGTYFTTNQGIVELYGEYGPFDAVSTLENNQGSFILGESRVFNTAGDFTNSGTIRIDGDGSALNVNGTYTGTAGSLLIVDAGFSSSGGASVAGTIRGIGTVTGLLSVESGGVIAPGDSVGTLHTANLEMNDGAVYQWEIDESNNDIVEVNGDLMFEDTAVLTVTADGTVIPEGDYVLFTVTGSIDPLPEWTINLPDGWYSDGVVVSGNQVLLTHLTTTPPTPTPTPTATPTPVPPTATPTTVPPTATPSLGPGEVDMELRLNQSSFTTDDVMILYFDLKVGTTDVDMDIYIALQIYDEFYFMPDFTTDVETLYSGVLPAGTEMTDIALLTLSFAGVELPELDGAWHGAVLNRDNYDLLDYCYVDFNLY